MQYSKYYDTKTIKMYRTGNSAQTMDTDGIQRTKINAYYRGALNIKLNINQMLDGYPGQEHNIPIYPAYKDVIEIMANQDGLYSNFIGHIWWSLG